jgi:hypothetical protein
MIDRIQQLADEIPFGTITIELNETSRTVDIVATSRERFPKQMDPPAGRQILVRKEVIQAG